MSNVPKLQRQSGTPILRVPATRFLGPPSGSLFGKSGAILGKIAAFFYQNRLPESNNSKKAATFRIILASNRLFFGPRGNTPQRHLRLSLRCLCRGPPRTIQKSAFRSTLTPKRWNVNASRATKTTNHGTDTHRNGSTQRSCQTRNECYLL